MKRLPFAYVKQQSILLQTASDQSYRLLHTADVKTEVLLEVQRFLEGTDFGCHLVTEDELQAQAEAMYAEGDGQVDLDLIDTEHLDLAQLAETLPEDDDLLEQEQNSPVVRLINGLFSEALKHKASDIHVETYEHRVSIRLRQDGVLNEVLAPDRRLAPLLVSRIKVMAKLDIAEKRVPQDGRITVKIAGRPVDVRVSTLPTSHGERIVMRILDQRSVQLDLAHLGMPADIQHVFNDLLLQPNGIILVTGPTGSGKTTSLYAGLSLLNEKSRNILTVEDPVEYALEGVGQTQVSQKTGMSFAKGLRAMLRQDPDVVMVGEIRDIETAQIAVQASLTGHLVLSTLHTNDAPSAITRLLDIGVEPYLIASSLRGVLAQRLVRKLCLDCRQPVRYAVDDVAALGVDLTEDICGYKAVGCATCNHSGYTGRQGIYELLLLDAKKAALINHASPESTLRQTLIADKGTLAIQALSILKNGTTDLSELLRTVRGI